MNISKRILIFLFTIALAFGMGAPKGFAANVPVEDITLNVSAKTLPAGKSFQIKAKFTPANATNKKIIWKSDNPVVAEVSDKGLVTAIDNGKTTIRATTEDGWIQRTVKITVGDSVKSIKLNKKHLKINWDQEEQLKVEFNPTYATNQEVTWVSDNEKIAKVDYDGWVWAEDTGTCNISAISKDGNKKATCKVTTYHTREQLLEDIIFWTNEEAKSKLGYYMDSCDVDNTNPYNYDAIYLSLKEEVKAWMDELIAIDYKGYQYANEIRCGLADITVSNYRPAKNSIWNGGREVWGYNGSFDFKVNVSLGSQKMSSNTMKMRINTASLSHQVDWLINTLHAEPWWMEDYWVDKNYPVPTIEEFIDEWVQECVDYAQLKGISYNVIGHIGSYKPSTASSRGHFNFQVSAVNPKNARTSGTITVPIVPTTAEMRYLGEVMWAIYDYDEQVGFTCDKEDLIGKDKAANIKTMKKKIKKTLKEFFAKEGYSDVKCKVRAKDNYSKPRAWKAVGDEGFKEGETGILDFEIDLKKNNSRLTVEQMEFWIYDGVEYTARKCLKELRDEFPKMSAKIDLYKDEYEEFEYILLTEDFAVPKGKTISLPPDETFAVEKGKKLTLKKGAFENDGGFLWIKGKGRGVGIEGNNYSETHYRKSTVVPENPASFNWALKNSKKIEVWDELTAGSDFTIGKGQTLSNLGFLDLKESTMTVKKGGRFINDAELCFWARGEEAKKPSIKGKGMIEAAKGDDAKLWAGDTPNLSWGWKQGFDTILVADDELVIPEKFSESSPFVIPKGKALTICPENKKDKEEQGVMILKGFLKIEGTLNAIGEFKIAPKFSYTPKTPVQLLSLELLRNPGLSFPNKKLQGRTIPWDPESD